MNVKLYDLYMENLRDHPTKNSSLLHDEKFRPLKAKDSLIEVQVNPRSWIARKFFAIEK